MKDTKRARAAREVHAMLGALEEHLSEAEREVTPGEAVENDLWISTLRAFRDALYNSPLPEKDGSLRITLTLGGQQ